MRCKEAEFWISLRVDREEVPAGKSGPLDQHLAACPSCRGLLSGEAQRSTILERSLGRPAGEEALLAARIIRQAAEPLQRLPSRPWGSSWLPATILAPLAAALLVLAVGTGWWWMAWTPGVSPRDPGYALLEQNSLDTDVYSTEAGEPVQRDTLRQRWVFSPVKVYPSPPGNRNPGEVILDVERVDTRYFRFADFQYR